MSIAETILQKTATELGVLKTAMESAIARKDTDGLVKTSMAIAKIKKDAYQIEAQMQTMFQLHEKQQQGIALNSEAGKEIEKMSQIVTKLGGRKTKDKEQC